MSQHVHPPEDSLPKTPGDHVSDIPPESTQKEPSNPPENSLPKRSTRWLRKDGHIRAILILEVELPEQYPVPHLPMPIRLNHRGSKAVVGLVDAYVHPRDAAVVIDASLRAEDGRDWEWLVIYPNGGFQTWLGREL